ncbi:DUF2332 family protein [Sphingomonas sp. LR60]|uniref:DUF2332 domain-containing protein n=1 Tax=Sphingomonas sp. LR60 TaxID=3050233 RepID=UPI002FE04F60
MPEDRSGELLRQSAVMRAIGSPFVADVLAAAARQLTHAPLTCAMLADWPGDPAAAAVAMRLNAALHALARRNTPPVLGALYRGAHDDFDGAVRAALRAHDAFIARWLRDMPQTNEVGRAAAILGALMEVVGRVALPVELIELGASAGLNLNLARYRYDLGGVSAGAAESAVRIAPEWRGAAAPDRTVDVVAAEGVDLDPLDPHDPATCERLMAYVFADQPARAARLAAALVVARQHPPRIAHANATTWLAERLATPQPAGRWRVVFHSMMAQYVDAAARASLDRCIAAAGARADAERPLARIAFEWDRTRSEVELRLSCWPGGDTRVLATCHPYGAWIDWIG